MATGFKSHVEGRAGRPASCSINGYGLSMRGSGLFMVSFSYDPALFDKDCSNHGVGTCRALSSPGKDKGTLHVDSIGHGDKGYHKAIYRGQVSCKNNRVAIVKRYAIMSLEEE